MALLRRLPTCDRCGHEVDSIDIAGVDHKADAVQVRLRCHGAEDIVLIPCLLYSQANVLFQITRAFRDRPADPDALREELDPERMFAADVLADDD